MFRPRLRKVRLKRAFDATLARGVARGARLVIVSSPRERDDVVACGVDPARVRLRGNAFPEPPPPRRRRSARRGRAGRRAGGPLRRPDRGREGHRAPRSRRRAGCRTPTSCSPARTTATGRWPRSPPRSSIPATAGRVHVLPPTAGPPYDLYRRADVFVLASGGRELRARRRRGGLGRDARRRLRPHRRRRLLRATARRSSSPTTTSATVDGGRARPRRRRAADEARRRRTPRGPPVDVGRGRRRAGRDLRGGARRA